MNSSLFSSRWFRISAVLLMIFLGILIGLPFLIKQQAQIWLEDNGGDRVTIRDVDFNPFTAELVLEDLLIEVEDRQPLHFDTARLELEWLPLLEKHIDVQTVELQGFYLLINNEDILRIGGVILPAGESEPETQETAGEVSTWLAGIHTLTLKDFTLVYHDAALDQRVYIDSLQLSELKQWDPGAPSRLEYRGAVNDAAVTLDAELAPFAQTPTYKGTLSVDKLSLTDFESLAKPALRKLAGLVSVQGDFAVEQEGDDIHVLNEGELTLEEISIDQEQIQLTNQSLDWGGNIDLNFNTASAQVRVGTKGELTVKDIDVQHELLHLSNQSLGWDGAMDLTLNTAAAQTSVKSEGKLTSTGLAADLQQQKLKLEYQNFDLAVIFSYTDSESGADIALNSDLLFSGLNLFAPEKKVDIVRARKLQLAGLEIKGPNHVTAEKITADGLDLGHSLEQQQPAADDDNRSIFHVEKVLISKFSHIDGFTAIDTIVEEDAHVVYHRNKEGVWNVVTLLDALAGEEKETGDGEVGQAPPDETTAEHKEKSAETSTANGEQAAAVGPPPIAVNRVDVSKGSTATIYDESVTPAFKTTLTINELFLENLDGRNPQQTATLKLDGRLDKHSSIKAGGDMKPYLQPPEMAMQGKLQAIGLPPLSPYTTDSMGIIINSGSLDVDLKLVSQNQLMKGEAVLLMHQLSVKGTDSKDGLQSKIPVPLDMALNILRDKNDTIELKIPIAGDAENPDVDVSDAITKAVATGVSAGATSYLVYALQPYGAMIAVAKVAGEAASKVRLEPVEFEPGQASLDDSDRDYLSKIAKVLKERPKLAVKVCGVAVQQDVAHLQPPADKADGKSGKKAAPPAAPVVDKQKLTELGEQRAASVKDYLVEKFKVPANRLVHCQSRFETDQADALPRTELLL